MCRYFIYLHNTTEYQWWIWQILFIKGKLSRDGTESPQMCSLTDVSTVVYDLCFRCATKIIWKLRLHGILHMCGLCGASVKNKQTVLVCRTVGVCLGDYNAVRQGWRCCYQLTVITVITTKKMDWLLILCACIHLLLYPFVCVSVMIH